MGANCILMKMKSKGVPVEWICYAPFKSMYFGHGGIVNPCCKNRDYVLGVYPNQSIKEIWLSGGVEFLRTALKKGDLSHGCFRCEKLIQSGNRKGLMAATYNSMPYNHNGYPTDLQFELSNTCNLECVMCSGDYSSLIRSKREKRALLKSVYDDNFVEQLKEFIPHLSQCSFYGGEPFLIDIYYTIWELITSLNPSVNISVQTNGTVLSNRVKELLRAGRFNIGVSVDSIHKATYESIRVNAAYESVQSNIKWFAQYCSEKGTAFNISVCPMQYNWFELANIIAFANSYNAMAFIHQLDSPKHAAINQMSAAEISTIHTTLSQSLEGYVFTGRFAEHNYQVLADYTQGLEQLLTDKQLPQTVNCFYNLYEMYDSLEVALLTQVTPGERDELIAKFKKALQGLETNDEVIQKFNHLDISSYSILYDMVSFIKECEPEHLRYLVLEQM